MQILKPVAQATINTSVKGFGALSKATDVTMDLMVTINQSTRLMAREAIRDGIIAEQQILRETSLTQDEFDKAVRDAYAT